MHLFVQEEEGCPLNRAAASVNEERFKLGGWGGSCYKFPPGVNYQGKKWGKPLVIEHFEMRQWSGGGQEGQHVV